VHVVLTPGVSRDGSAVTRAPARVSRPRTPSIHPALITLVVKLDLQTNRFNRNTLRSQLSNSTLSVVAAAGSLSSMPHYCNRSDADILDDIIRGNIPDDALASDCCWKRICQVRGRHFNKVDPDTWSEICRERGYVRTRENPRGF
jgi:hypothetical protein